MLICRDEASFVTPIANGPRFFNAFRLLHMMGDQQLVVTGSAAGDGVGAGASRSADGSKIQVLVYNHTDGSAANVAAGNIVSLTVNNLPFTGTVRARQYIVDYAHANSYRPWLAMNDPTKPTQAQWVTLRDAAELCYYDTTLQATAGSVTFTFRRLADRAHERRLMRLRAGAGRRYASAASRSINVRHAASWFIGSPPATAQPLE
jgi:hypothetical protein